MFKHSSSFGEQSQAASGPTLAAPAVPIDALAQARASELVQDAMYHYWHGGDPQRFERELYKGITLRGRFDRVEQCLREACQLVPERLDLRFGLASTLVVQNRVEEALAMYQEIAALDPRGFEAPLLRAAYTKALGRHEEAGRLLSDLSRQHPERTAAYVEKFERAERTLQLEVQTIPSGQPRGKGHAIVVLGYALAKDGSLQPTKLRRLEKALELAVTCDSPIVLTGGVQQSGVTEAFIMSRWLQEKGIPARRLWLEDQAEDTVGNAIFCAPILRELGASAVSIVSSASHIRRALVVFEETTMSFSPCLDHVVEMDLATAAEAAVVRGKERLFVYRDLLRGSGLWAYPGVQR